MSDVRADEWELLWSEDDARTPDREMLREAWLRLTGRELSTESTYERHDQGDNFVNIMASGWRYDSRFDGHHIYRKRPEVVPVVAETPWWDRPYGRLAYNTAADRHVPIGMAYRNLTQTPFGHNLAVGTHPLGENMVELLMSGGWRVVIDTSTDNYAIYRPYNEPEDTPEEDVPESTPEHVDHPAHYGGADDPYEAIKVIEAWQLDFHLGNTVKYIARAGKKDDELEDLLKARWYLDRKIAKLKGLEA